MDKKNQPRISQAQINRALELQVLIANYHPELLNKTVSFTRPAWETGRDEGRLAITRNLAKSKGFKEEDFIARNEIVNARNKAISPIKHLRKALVATYVTSSNYYNNSLRRRLNPVQQMVKEPLTMTMSQIVDKFAEKSEAAAHAMGFSLYPTFSGMRLQGKLSNAFSTSLLKNLLLENKKPNKSYRGIVASQQFIASLDFFSKNNAIVKIDQFMSTTTMWSIARDFSQGKYDSTRPLENDQRVIFIVEGTSGAEISAWLDEGEVLYPPESYFQVASGGYLEYAMHIGAKVYRLKEVYKPAREDKVPFLTDVAKLQRQQMNRSET
ncbi:ADP-ribosyltransferase domain-containing protein [Enterobacter asburiae]